MEFTRQEYWSGLPFPSPGYLPDPGIEPGSPALEADALTPEPPGKPREEAQVMSNSLRPHGLSPARLLSPWDFPGNSTGVDCHFLLQEVFPTQGSNPGLPHCRQTLYHLSHQGSITWIIQKICIKILTSYDYSEDT